MFTKLKKEQIHAFYKDVDEDIWCVQRTLEYMAPEDGDAAEIKLEYCNGIDDIVNI